MDDEGFTEAKKEECLEELSRVTVTDMYHRMLQSRGTLQNEGQQNQYISIDSFAGFLLDTYVEGFVMTVEQMTSRLKLACSATDHESRISFTKFQYAVC